MMFSSILIAPPPSADLVGQIWHQMANDRGTTIYKLQKKFQNVFGFTLPLFHGRGLLNCQCLLQASFYLFDGKLLFTDNLGLMPYRRRLVSVSEYSSGIRMVVHCLTDNLWLQSAVPSM
jgi:hypothetical protein